MMPVMTETIDSRELALRIRLRAVRMVAPHGFGYLGQALSSAELFATVFGAMRPGLRPPGRLARALHHRAVRGRGRAGAARRVLVRVERLRARGDRHRAVPGGGLTGGSLGLGLSAALGFALADRFRGSDARVFALVSDGELEEGQVWEAAIFAAHHRLDRSSCCSTPTTRRSTGPSIRSPPWSRSRTSGRAFGWRVFDIDGHDMAAVSAALGAAGAEPGRPSVLVCRTSTRHGLDCLPPDADGHFIKLPPSLVAAAVSS